MTPILYIPEITRQDLRAVETCPDTLKPLAELQFRGVIWSQVNAKDWTVLAFLKSNQGGLGLDVAQDTECKHAMQLALYRVLDEEIEMLRGKHLDKDYFNTLLSGGDPGSARHRQEPSISAGVTLFAPDLRRKGHGRPNVCQHGERSADC